jgi:DNA-directed RNA polymerase subunit RPC12/RpoP
MTIRVYFESIKGIWAEEVATFEHEEHYIACLPALEALAAQKNAFVSESMTDDVQCPRCLSNLWFLADVGLPRAIQCVDCGHIYSNGRAKE